MFPRSLHHPPRPRHLFRLSRRCPIQTCRGLRSTERDRESPTQNLQRNSLVPAHLIPIRHQNHFLMRCRIQNLTQIQDRCRGPLHFLSRFPRFLSRRIQTLYHFRCRILRRTRHLRLSQVPIPRRIRRAHLNRFLLGNHQNRSHR